MNNSNIENSIDKEIKPYEIYAFNLWVFVTIFYFLYMSLCIIPPKYFEIYLHMDFLPDRYWYTAIPTHILVSLVTIFFVIKCLELIKTVDNPPYKDFYYKELDINEMRKEIDINPREGILPDAGDIREDIVKAVIEMDDE
jgi:hypothetical protein